MGLLLTLISGFMLIVSWPALGNLWPLVFIAFVPMFLAQYRFMPRRLSGLPVGVAFACYWFGGLQMASGLVGIWPVILAAIVIGLIGWLIGSFDRRFAERTRYRWFIVQFALIWVAIDLLVQRNLIIASMNWIAYRLWQLPRLVQPVSVVGTPVLSFLIVVINAWFALLIIKLLDGRRPKFCPQAIPRRVASWSSVIVVVVLLVWVVSSLLIFSSIHHDQGPAVTVAAVQPGIKYAPPQITYVGSGKPLPRALNEKRRDAQEIQLASMTKKAASEGARLVVWPEWNLDYDPRTTRTAWIPDLARSTHTYIIAAFVPHPESAETPNMSGLWAPDGSLQAVYYKIHPVIPMGEKFHAPEIYQTFQTELGPLSMMICFDVDFPPESRLLTLTGAELIGVPSAGPAKTGRFRISSLVFRAIENRVSYVRADLAWESVIVGPDGVVKKRTASTSSAGGTALLVAAVNRGPRNAPYSRIGDIVGLVIFFFLGCRIVWQIVYWRRTRSIAAQDLQ
ncbi:MAG: nitrilase-related carbon-nitrogen hydrolase [Candidatus Geothermincolia bacterium]